MDPDLPIHLYTDASDIGFGIYLCQRRADGTEIPIGFMSRTFNQTQRRWSVPEREAYGIYEGVKKFDYLVRDRKFTIHTDHRNLTYIRDSGSPKVIRWKLELQEHDFIVVHVPGKDNEVADYLSRNPEAKEDDYEPQTMAVCKYLAWMRVEDARLAEAEEIASCNIRHTFLTIPEKYFQNIKSTHNEAVGHHGVERTLQMLDEAKSFWKYRRQHVERYIQQCDVCQKMDASRLKVSTQPYTTGGYRPHEQLAMDSIGPFPEDDQGNKYAMVVIDCFSRFLAVYPTPDVSATSAARVLLKHMGTFLVTPCEIRSDNGPENANKMIKEFLDLVGTDRIETLAYSHEENSLVERANKEVNRWLRDCLYSQRKNKSEWSQMIPFVTRIHNATPISTIGCAPADIVFGRAVTGDARVFLPRTPADDEVVDEYLTRRLADQEVAITKARNMQEQHDTAHTGTHDVEETTVYEKGSYVLLAWPDDRLNLRRPTKLDSLYRGPYKVIDVRAGIYTLLDLVSGKSLPPKGVHSLKPFLYDPARTDPVEVALRDYPEHFMVQQIIDFKGVWTRVKTLRFRVRWIGYTPEQDTWESWEFLRDNGALHEYLTSMGKGHLIPKKIVATEEQVTKNRKRAFRDL